MNVNRSEELEKQMSWLDKSKIGAYISYIKNFSDYDRKNWHNFMDWIYDGKVPKYISQYVDWLHDLMDKERKQLTDRLLD